MSKTNNLEETLTYIKEIRNDIEKNAQHALKGTLKEDLEAIVREGFKTSDDKKISTDDDINDMVGDSALTNPDDGSPDTKEITPKTIDLDGGTSDDDLGNIDEPSLGDNPGEPEVIDLTGAEDDEVIAKFGLMEPTDEIEITKTPTGGIQINIGPIDGVNNELSTDDLDISNNDVDDSNTDNEFDNETPNDDDTKEKMFEIDIVDDDTKEIDEHVEPYLGNKTGLSGKSQEIGKVEPYPAGIPNETFTPKVGGGDTNIGKTGDTKEAYPVKNPAETAEPKVSGGGTKPVVGKTGDTKEAYPVKNPAETAEPKVKNISEEVDEITRMDSEEHMKNQDNTNENIENEIDEDNIVSKNHMRSHTKHEEELHESLVNTRKKLNTLMADNKQKEIEIKKVNEIIKDFKTSEIDYKTAINSLKGQLQEVALYTSNLTYIVKLITENSTTKDEKIDIIKRLDAAKTLTESREIYNSLESSFNDTKKSAEHTIAEQILNKTKASSSSTLNESTAYQNPQMGRIRELMQIIK